MKCPECKTRFKRKRLGIPRRARAGTILCVCGQAYELKFRRVGPAKWSKRK